MSYSQDEVIEMAAIKVQEVVCQKVEHFTDSVTKEVHQMHLEMKSNREFDSAIIAQFNDLKFDVAELQNMRGKVDRIHTLFCGDGYMEKFDKLCDAWNNYLARDRVLTCPLTEDVKQNAELIRENTKMIREEREYQEAHRNGQVKTRREDKFKTTTIIISMAVALASWLTLATKLVGIW